MKSSQQGSIRMAHDNPDNVLTAGYPVSYVRFAVLIPRRLQSEVKPGVLSAWFSYCFPQLNAITCNYHQLLATLKNIAFHQQPIL